MSAPAFNYNAAFSRNIGWTLPEEQQLLRQKKVAIAGCGGVGCIHTLTLARLGIGRFALADFDQFGIENFNRQVGATMQTVGKNKLDVTSDMLRDINPEVEISRFPAGISADNVEQFLHGVDLYIDSLDFFAIDARRAVFAACDKMGIPAITAAPLGMGTAFLCFMPGKMSFEDYFGMAGATQAEQYLRFYLGLAPAALQTAYLVKPDTVNLEEKRGPSTIVGCTISAAVAAAYAAKILLKRGELVCAPKGMQLDGYCNKLKKTWMPFGHRNPWFKIKLAIAKRKLGMR
jgi:molybdopterin/thiamine biosynthesis adenylyltransferase